MSNTPSSRSYKKHWKEVESANKKRNRLLEKGESGLSLPSGMGRLAVVVSRVVDHRFQSQTPDGEKAPLSAQEQLDASMETGKRLARERADWHRYGADLYRRATAPNLRFLLADPEVTDLILVGHGSISDLWTEGGGHFDWLHAAKAATHLKQGKIEQRMCGHFARDKHRNVPLGAFVVSDPANVIAATGEKLHDALPRDDAYQPVFSSGGDVLEQIAILNQQFEHQAEPKKR